MVRAAETATSGAETVEAEAAGALETPPVVYRQMRFELEDVPRYWHSDSPAITHFFHALSLTFPEGEKFFIDSVRAYEGEIDDPELLAEIRGFAQQESHHGYQHRLLNELAGRHGLPMARIDRWMEQGMRWTRRLLGRESQLAATIALEHFTAILAHQLLTEPRFTDGMHEKARALWQWHALEETEHKAVAFDVYQAVGGSYWRRVLVMLQVIATFPLDSTWITVYLLWKDGRLRDRADLRRGLRFVWGRGGLFRAILPHLWPFLRRDFHPWQVDDRALIPEHAARLAPWIVRESVPPVHSRA